MTTCSPLSMRTLKKRDDVKKLKNQNTHTGQETHYEQYMTNGMTTHDMHIWKKVQKHHYVKGRRQRLEAARLEETRVPEVRAQLHKKHYLQKDDHRKQHQQLFNKGHSRSSTLSHYMRYERRYNEKKKDDEHTEKEQT
eukprot:6488070-Amphidinium_carterae.1